MGTSKFNHTDFINRIVSFSPRQYTGEIKTADFLESFLKERNIDFSVHKFKTKVPVEKKSFLKADGEKIPCKSTCFVSGKIPNKDNLVSSLCEEVEEADSIKYNINFNPYCNAISCATFYDYPAVAISRKDVNKVLKAKNVEGSVTINPKTYDARNILVGNKKNPKVICFAHYDSILKSAWDNASGVSTMMSNIVHYPETLKNVLYVFTANEELSYDKNPGYWCKGFRAFENKYNGLLENTKKIIVIDCVGNSPPAWKNKYETLENTILFRRLKKFKPKMGAVTSSYFAKHIYHSELDDVSQIKKKYLIQADKKLHNNIMGFV